MKTLLIMRHAKSSWKDAEIPDHERPLKKRGLKDAAHIGKLLKKEDLVPDKIISSNAVRAADTAAIVADKCGYKKEIEYTDKLYMAEGGAIISLIQSQPDSINKLLVIGHNPGMEALVQELSSKVDSLSTASAVYFRADINTWKDLQQDKKIKLKKILEA